MRRLSRLRQTVLDFIYSGTGGLYVRSMHVLEDRLIPGTPTDSGSRDVIMFTRRPIRRGLPAIFSGGGVLILMPIAGGAKVKLTDNQLFALGGTWGSKWHQGETRYRWHPAGSRRMERPRQAARDYVEVRRTGIPAAALARR